MLEVENDPLGLFFVHIDDREVRDNSIQEERVGGRRAHISAADDGDFELVGEREVCLMRRKHKNGGECKSADLRIHHHIYSVIFV